MKVFIWQTTDQKNIDNNEESIVKYHLNCEKISPNG